MTTDAKANHRGQETAEPSDMTAEVEALQEIFQALRPLDREAQLRLLDTLAAFFGSSTRRVLSSSPSRVGDSTGPAYPSFSSDLSISPKDFLLEKQPRTDVERVACLAYYLTHYRDMPHFKTLDVSKLNTEAAQPKFSNTANSVNNAVKRGYLVPASKGYRQLSAQGEQFVQALPDRDAARQVMATLRPRRRRSRAKGVTNVTEG
jgi:hypothetical protein